VTARRWRELTPGVAVAFVIAIIGIVVHQRWDVVSPHVIAVGFGIIGATLGRVDAAFRPGLRFAAKRVLRGGIVLLGFRLSLAELGKLGPRALAAVVIVVIATFFGTRWLARRLGLTPSLGLLMATGYSICGASAIAAVEPFADATEEEVAYAIALVTLCGTLAIAVLPLLGSLLGLTDGQFGAWVGASVHDVGQVVAAASTRGGGSATNASLKLAVIVKLTRVALLAPLLAGVAVKARRRDAAESIDRAKRPPLLPLFIVLFLGAAALRSAGAVPAAWRRHIQDVETLLLGMGLFGLGSNVDLRKLRAVGGRPLVLGLASWALVAAVSLLAVRVSGL
jgi:uncharacterized integral membrane protein (TIGR00698 family)